MIYADVSDRALIRATNRLLELAPEDPASHVARGDAFVAMRRTRGAEAAFRRALELDPNDSSALRGLAAAQQRRGMFGDSVSVLATDLAVRPADDRTLTLLRQALVAAVLRWEVSLWATWLLLMIAAPTVPDAARFGAQLAVVAASIGFAVWFWRRFGRSSRRGLRPALRQARSRDRFLVVIAAAAAVGWVCCAAVPFVPAEARDILLTKAGWTFFGTALLTGVRWTLK
ncbi:tetratricopeptide repeat protein [Protaetiibacter sp. WY-16]|uniref:Tetratricopeptide repeat protein n=2 Tax=Antiquaquibacter soli TaxID=3064523 RepID=A0ABT9BJZ7_9MICO|nr:tetratricopeptide repeat protein [Protaetiibacter sp. WY-16]MDO7881344.1 tetratricopeptide repeat protein [Protaetiibacter sp. WY-16]